MHEKVYIYMAVASVGCLIDPIPFSLAYSIAHLTRLCQQYTCWLDFFVSFRLGDAGGMIAVFIASPRAPRLGTSVYNKRKNGRNASEKKTKQKSSGRFDAWECDGL